MEGKSLTAVLCQDHSFRLTSVLAQQWREKKYSYKKTPRPDFGLMYVLKGAVRFVMEENRLTVREGGVVFLPKGCYYEAEFISETEDILINFEGEGLPLCQEPLFLLEASAALVSLFEALVGDAAAERTHSLAALGHFYLLLDTLAAQSELDEKKEDALVRRACRYLQSEENHSIAAIARLCAISESGLRRLFKAQTGMTLLAYRRAYRLREAKRLLENTDLSLSEIAARLHFFDAAHFSRVFHGAFGVSPGEYAKEKKMRL